MAFYYWKLTLLCLHATSDRHCTRNILFRVQSFTSYENFHVQDEEAAVLHTHGWLGMVFIMSWKWESSTCLFYALFPEGWNDDRLKWDKSQYGGVESVHVANGRVWKGDIRAFNSISHEDYEDTNVIIHSDGRIFWIPPITFHTSCDFGSVVMTLKDLIYHFRSSGAFKVITVVGGYSDTLGDWQ